MLAAARPAPSELIIRATYCWSSFARRREGERRLLHQPLLRCWTVLLLAVCAWLTCASMLWLHARAGSCGSVREERLRDAVGARPPVVIALRPKRTHGTARHRHAREQTAQQGSEGARAHTPRSPRTRHSGSTTTPLIPCVSGSIRGYPSVSAPSQRRRSPRAARRRGAARGPRGSPPRGK